MREIPRPYERYRHFKGNMYQVLNIAKHSETEEMMVVYQQLYGSYEVYVRPLHMFMSEVDRTKYPDATQTYRFEKVDKQASASASGTSEQMPASANKIYEQTSASVIAKTGVTSAVTPGKLAVEPAITPLESESEEGVDPGLLRFLDAETYEEKLSVLHQLHPVITDELIDAMAASIDTEVEKGDIEKRYSDLRYFLLTMEKFECNRLR